ncbi:MAG: dihydroneopterin triphosphate diphosphatase [Candidatus Thiodiazotropha sp.]
MPTPVYKRPESVLVVVYTRQGEVLMLRRTRPNDFWQSVTGSLRWGESPVSTARRELYEETGIMAGAALRDLHHSVSFPILPAWRSCYAPSARSNREHWFALPLSLRRQPHLHADEHTEYRWLYHEQAARLASSWTNRDAIRYLFS